MSNPYESPPEPKPFKPEKRFDLSKVDLAKYSWRIPLYGMLISIGVNIFSRPFAVGAALQVGAAFLFVACIAAGFVVSIAGIIMSRKLAGVAAHAIGGLILNSFLAISFFTLLHAISIPREAAVDNHEQPIIQK
ncbi:MAG: hypothetical protein MUC83_16940 [Pirellula sp.]|nr:hypothetical protein [Pirellula sp.]